MDRYGSYHMNDIAYAQRLNRHRKIMPIETGVPKVSDSWVAPNATLVGNVHVSKWATIWYGAVL